MEITAHAEPGSGEDDSTDTETGSGITSGSTTSEHVETKMGGDCTAKTTKEGSTIVNENTGIVHWNSDLKRYVSNDSKPNGSADYRTRAT